MKKPHIIGLTGGIAAGKSTVVQYIYRGYDPALETLYDCDAAVHRLYDNFIMKSWLKEKFSYTGDDVRTFCSSLVQRDPGILDVLEGMFVPIIRNEIEEMINNAFLPFVIIDAPLLFETNLHQVCDSIIVVHAPEAVRRERAKLRLGMNEDRLNLMIRKQLKDDDRLALADFVINTDCALLDTYLEIDKVLVELKVKIDAR